MHDVPSAMRVHCVRGWISSGRRAKNGDVLGAPVELKRFVDGVTSLVADDSQGLSFRSPFRLQHQPTFEPDKAGMGEIEWDGEADDTVRVEPLL